jgi:hypothetical protein
VQRRGGEIEIVSVEAGTRVRPKALQNPCHYLSLPAVTVSS